MRTGRRSFLIGGTGLALGGGLGLFAWLRSRSYAVDPPLRSGARKERPKATPLPHDPFDPRALETLKVLVDDLLPGAEDLALPSAGAVGVVGYLTNAARQPGLKRVRADMLKLLRHLDRVSKDAQGLRFIELAPPLRSDLLGRIAAEEATPGGGGFRAASALATTLQMALEGYLGHPHHGGNRDAAVWKALSIHMPLERGCYLGGQDRGGGR